MVESTTASGDTNMKPPLNASNDGETMTTAKPDTAAGPTTDTNTNTETIAVKTDTKLVVKTDEHHEVASDKTKHDPTSQHNDQNHQNDDGYSLVLKPQYILSSTHSVMTPASDTRDDNNRSTSNNNNNENNEPHPNQKQKPNRHKKNKRELKKRSREMNQHQNVCKSAISGKECPFGDSCKFTHDLKEMLANRVDDIKEIDSCPHYDLKGECPFGLLCRVGSYHLNIATGQNISQSKEEIELLKQKHDTKIMNIPSRKVVGLLRKKKYEFVCKRHFEQKKKKKTDEEKHVEEEKKGVEGMTGVQEENKSTVTKQEEEKSNAIKQEEEKSTVIKQEEDESNTIKQEEEKSNAIKQEEMKSNAIKQEEIMTEEVKANESTKNNDTAIKDVNSNSKAPIDMSPLPKTRKLIDFSNKVYVAPLTTVGNLPFRRIMKKFGADITCGEMAVANNLLQGKSGEWALLKRHPEEDVFGVQIAAGYADVWTRISEVIQNEELDVDFLDMNLGCPIDVLCNQGCGAKMMLKESKLRESILGMTNALDIPVTVKIRTGWDEKKPFAHKLVPKIQEWGIDGVAAVMMHGRSRLQRYSKLANWDYIQQVAAAQSDDIPKLPIIGNGDIFSYTDYEEKVLKHEGLSPTAMIGRGALIKPWLPTEIKERRHWDISATERLDYLKDFVKFGLEHWGSDQRGVNATRRFLLEWLSFLHRYVPVGILEVVPQAMNQRPPAFMCGRNDLETLMMSKHSKDWVKISEMVLGPAPDGFEFEPKHKAKSYK